jgi:apolipoprotein N-acyltransferase
MLAMAPTHVALVLAATLPVLLWLSEGALKSEGKPGWRQVAVIGWWFAFGYHWVGLYWIGEAFLVQADVFAWLLPLAVMLMPAGLALFHAATLGAAARAGLLEQAPLAQATGLAVALAASDWLRGHILTGFPWNLLGYALTWPLVVMQSAGLVGIYGLTLLAAFMFTAPAVLLARSAGAGVMERRRVRASAVAVIAVPLAVMLAWGAFRLSGPESGDVAGVKLRLVQPSIAQPQKWRPERQREIFEQHVGLSLAGPDGLPDNLKGITHVIWAEAAMPFMPLAHPDVMARVGAMLPKDTLLLSGILRLEQLDGVRFAYNSLAVISDGGKADPIYDKIHLVPFGEYLPFQRTLEAIGLETLTRQRGGFSIGVNPRQLLSVPGLPPMTVLICYEAIFPAAVVQGPVRPGMILNVTNDGWFGATAGPHQHFHQARLRAVEEGVPLVRVANNGISAIIDPYGRIRASLGLNREGVVDGALPKAASPPPYGRIHDVPFIIAWIGLLAWLTLRRSPVG